MSAGCEYAFNIKTKTKEEAMDADLWERLRDKAMSLEGYLNALNTSNGDNILSLADIDEDLFNEGDIISSITGGTMKLSDIKIELPLQAMQAIDARLTQVTKTLLSLDSHKEYLKLKVDGKASYDFLNAVNFLSRRQKIVNFPMKWFNLQKRIFGANFDMYGAYLQNVNNVAPLSKAYTMLNRSIDKTENAKGGLYNAALNSFRKGHQSFSGIAKRGELAISHGDGEFDSLLKFFNYKVSNFDGHNLNSMANITKFNTFLSRIVKTDVDMEVTKELYNSALNTVKEFWDINYGRDLSKRMIEGEFQNKEITWDDVQADNTSILGLRKSLMIDSKEMYGSYARFLDAETRSFYEGVFKEIDEGSIQQFYVPIQRVFNKEDNDLTPTEDRQRFNPTTVMKFLGNREMGDAVEIDTSYQMALEQHVEYMKLGFNAISHSLFYDISMGYLDEAGENLDFTTKEAVKALAKNVKISGAPSRKGTPGVERLKKIMSLSSFFPALMISKPASGINNIIGSGMGMYNGDYLGYTISNKKFDEALKSGNDLAVTVNKIIESEFLEGGLTQSFLRRVDSPPEERGPIVDNVLNNVVEWTNKLADFSVNGYFLKNWDWYHKFLTVPGSEREILRTHLKTLAYQHALGEVEILSYKRGEDIRRIKNMIEDNRYDSASIKERIADLVEGQIEVANKTGNIELKTAMEDLVSSEYSENSLRSFIRKDFSLSSSEKENIIVSSIMNLKPLLDQSLGDFSRTNKPYIENLMLRDANTYSKVLLGGILKATSYFNMVGRVASTNYALGLNSMFSTMFKVSGYESSNDLVGLASLKDFDRGQAAVGASVLAGTALAIYGILSGFFEDIPRVTSLGTHNPLEAYTPPLQLLTVEGYGLLGVLSGLGFELPIPDHLKEEIYMDNIRWATGALAGKNASQLYEETIINGEVLNPYKKMFSAVENLGNLYETIAYGLTEVDLSDRKDYYDWRSDMGEYMYPYNHLAPVYAMQKAVETFSEFSGAHEPADHSLASTNLVKNLARWFLGTSIWWNHEYEFNRTKSNYKYRHDALQYTYYNQYKNPRLQHPYYAGKRSELRKFSNELRALIGGNF